MRVLYFSSSSIPSRTANSVHVMRMASALVGEGCQLRLLGRFRKEEIEDGVEDWHSYYGVPNNFLIARSRWRRNSALSLLGYIFMGWIVTVRWRPDLVISRNLVASWLLARMGFRVIHEAHAPWKFSGKIGELLFRDMVKASHFVGLVVISQPLLDDYLGSGLITRDAVIVCHDGATLAPRDDLTAPSGSFDARPLIGYAGSLYEGRGIDLICEIARRCPWADFVVVGGPNGEADTWTRRSTGLGNIKFLGHIPPAEVAGALRRFDCLLAPYQPTTRDGVGNVTSAWMSPLKIFEYMAAGSPIIASDLAVLREVLAHEGNCLLADPTSPQEWVDSISRLQDLPELGHAIAAQALEDLKDKYSWSVRARSILGFATA